VPGAADVLGIAHASASVTVNGQATSRKGEYFWKEVGANNTNGVVNLGITNQAVLAGTTNIATGNLLLPMAGQRYWYDADGNMLSDGVWTNTWDAENRLITTETTTAVPEAARAKEIWSYYADGRWSERLVYAWTNGDWAIQSTRRFVWDGNVIVAILDGNNSLLQTFLRGLDLSGTPQGAGGAGGLLAICDLPSVMTCFYAHDGNGNVVALVSASDGSVAARYEYGPFAEPIRMTGPLAQVNPMRFSGQFMDYLAGRLKYLYREYSSGTGRWQNGDPMKERRAENRFAFLRNEAVAHWDYLGLFSASNGTPHTGLARHNSYLEFTVRCPSCTIITNIIIDYSQTLAGLHALGLDDDMLRDAFDGAFSGPGSLGGPDGNPATPNWTGDPVVIRVFMRTRLANQMWLDWLHVAFRLVDGFPALDVGEVVGAYAAGTSINYDCQGPSISFNPGSDVLAIFW